MKLSVGEVLGQAWILYTRFLLRLIAVAFIVFGFLSLVAAAIGPTRNVFLIILVTVVNVVGVYWVQGALVVTAADLRDGKLDLSIGDTFQRVEPRLLTLIMAGILVAVGVGLGLVLLLLPGLILMTFWSAVTPAVVLEKRGVVDALKRSQRLVSGDAMRVFAVVAITIILATVVSAVIRALLLPLPDFFDIYLSSVIANSITIPFVALSWTVMYFDLKLNKG